MATAKSPMDKIVFVTKTSFKDWPKFLAGEFETKWQGCKYDFDDKWLMLNNGVPEAEFPCMTFHVEDYQNEVLDFFQLKRDDFKLNGYDGYWYSIAELTSIYLAKDFKYLCYLQSDCSMFPPYDWITQGIKELEKYSVVSPYSQVNTWGKTDHFFSDQAFLIRVDEFRQPIYGIEGYMKEYPIYGGNYFEMMIGKHLHKTGKERKIIREAWYEHG